MTNPEERTRVDHDLNEVRRLLIEGQTLTTKNIAIQRETTLRANRPKAISDKSDPRFGKPRPLYVSVLTGHDNTKRNHYSFIGTIFDHDDEGKPQKLKFVWHKTKSDLKRDDWRVAQVSDLIRTLAGDLSPLPHIQVWWEKDASKAPKWPRRKSEPKVEPVTPTEPKNEPVKFGIPPLRIACPRRTCRAQPGQPCKTRSGRRIDKPHEQRMKIASRRVDKERHCITCKTLLSRHRCSDKCWRCEVGLKPRPEPTPVPAPTPAPTPDPKPEPKPVVGKIAIGAGTTKPEPVATNQTFKDVNGLEWELDTTYHGYES